MLKYSVSQGKFFVIGRISGVDHEELLRITEVPFFLGCEGFREFCVVFPGYRKLSGVFFAFLLWFWVIQVSIKTNRLPVPLPTVLCAVLVSVQANRNARIVGGVAHDISAAPWLVSATSFSASAYPNKIGSLLGPTTILLTLQIRFFTQCRCDP